MPSTRKKKSATRKRTGKQKLKVALINSGQAGLLHFPSLLDHPDVNLVAMAHLDGGRLQPIAEQSGIPSHYTDYVSMIETEKPDAVYITVSPIERYDIVATCISMGCNTFVMKPPALTSEQIRQLAVLAQKHRVLTGVVFYRRFSHLVRRGKAQCETKGPVHTAVATFYKEAVGAPPYSRGGIDILTSDAIHAVDTLRYMCGGEVESVASDVRSLGATHTNAYQALVKFSTGATGVILTNWMAGRRMFTVEIHSPGISCFGDLEEGGVLYADNKVKPTEHIAGLANDHDTNRYRSFGIDELSIPKTGWHRDVNRHFLDCIRKNKQPETCFDDALKTMELVDAIYQSQI
ncbi:MAG: Gfo/Idh/MocA family oxidoreductase [bacterium]|nr:Gfo/Idh/MocA family oxidoreductase [bacterium]